MLARLARDRGGQASVEAALLVPVTLVLVALLAQPACVLYTRSVMAATAAELTRLAATTRDGEGDHRAFALRRLAAVPDVPVFHEGGPEAWEVEVTGPGDEGRVRAVVQGSVRPLPILGAIVAALGEPGGGGVRLRVEVTREVRADWIGGAYAEWIGVWD